jgi:hypothetical protein
MQTFQEITRIRWKTTQFRWKMRGVEARYRVIPFGVGGAAINPYGSQDES